MQIVEPEVFDTEGNAVAASLGELDALGALFEHFHDPLLRYLRTRTHNNVTLAEDVSGETWERVALSIGQYRTKGAGFEAWLFTIARRCLAAHYRLASRRPERLDGEMLGRDLVDDTPSPHEQLARKLEQHQIAAAVNALPPAQRRCVTLRFVVGLTYVETGRVMGKNDNAIKQLQRRALRALSKQIGDLADQPRGCHLTVGALVSDSTRMEERT